MPLRQTQKECDLERERERVFVRQIREREREILVCVCVRDSVTRWLDYFFKFGHLQLRKFAKKHKNLSNWVFNFAKYKIKRERE